MSTFARKLYSIIKRVEVWCVIFPSQSALPGLAVIWFQFLPGIPNSLCCIGSDGKSTILHNTGRVTCWEKQKEGANEWSPLRSTPPKLILICFDFLSGTQNGRYWIGWEDHNYAWFRQQLTFLLVWDGARGFQLGFVNLNLCWYASFALWAAEKTK